MKQTLNMRQQLYQCEILLLN